MQTWKKLKKDGVFYLSKKYNRGFAPPERVSINLTLRCNLTCTMCTTCYDSPELSLSEIQDIIDQTADWGVEVFNPLGGEPFMRADLEQILRYAVKKGFYVTLTTNGTLLSPSRAKYLAEIPTDRLHFNFSLDGDQRSNDLIRGEGSFQKTIRGFQNLRQADQTQGNARRKMLTNTILHAQNMDNFIEILREQAQLGFDGVQILNLFRSEEKEVHQHLWFQPDQLKKLQRLSQKLVEIRQNGGLGNFMIQNSVEELEKIPVYYSEALKPLEAPCWAGWKELYINADGQAIMCDGQLDFLRGAFGSVREKSLRELWNSTEIAERRRVVKQCQTPCVQTCYLRQSSDSGRVIAKEGFKLGLKELNDWRRTQFQAWQKIPNSIVRFELSDVSHSDWEGESTPSHRWRECIRGATEIPNVSNWNQLRDTQKLDFSRGFMGFAFLRKWIGDLKRARLQFQTLSLSWRGELFLHPEIEPILSFCFEQVQKGVFQRIQIETSGAYLTDKLAQFARENLPQTWIFDLDRGEGKGVGLLQKNKGPQTQLIVKHWVHPYFQQTGWHQLSALPIWIGSQPPREKDWFWFSRLEQENYFLDQLTDRKLEECARELELELHKQGAGNQCLAPYRTMVISWDGKVSLCPRDIQLQNVVGDANHRSLGDIWRDLDGVRQETEGKGYPNKPFCQDCGWFYGTNAL